MLCLGRGNATGSEVGRAEHRAGGLCDGQAAVRRAPRGPSQPLPAFSFFPRTTELRLDEAQSSRGKISYGKFKCSLQVPRSSPAGSWRWRSGTRRRRSRTCSSCRARSRTSRGRPTWSEGSCSFQLQVRTDFFLLLSFVGEFCYFLKIEVDNLALGSFFQKKKEKIL